MPTLLLGQTLEYSGNPFTHPWQDVIHHRGDGAVLVEGGKIAQVGSAAALRAAHPDADIVDYGRSLILPGFVDAHAHYPQTAMIASWGKRLLDWLETYTFPEEMRLSDPAYAQEIANRYLDLLLAHGTTSVASFCTSAPISVEAFFQAATDRNMAVLAGKTCMDRNAPDGLCDTPQRAYEESKSLLQTWHGVGRNRYAITPRFSPTSSPEQLEALGALWAEYPNVTMQTHISEQVEEIEWVRELYPTTRDYLDSYEKFGLLRPGAIFGHAIFLEPREIDRLGEIDASLIHCPTSNMFIGSGLFQTDAMAKRGLRVGLATDTGGGSSFSMLRTMAAAYEVGQLSGTALHAAQLIWMATAGSATALHMQDEIGSLSAGHAADITVIDLASTPAIAQRSRAAEGFWEACFPTLMMGDDRAIQDVWVAGKRVTAGPVMR